MAEKGVIYLTYAGRNLLAKAMTGQGVHFTRVAVGDGTIDFENDDIFALTALKHHVKDIPIAECKLTGDGTVTIKAQQKNEGLTQGFFTREYGIFAEDSETGNEVLYSYLNNGDQAGYIPAGNGSQVVDTTAIFVCVVDQCEKITAVIDANLAYVSQNEFETHVYSTNPHPNIPNLMNAITATTEVWAAAEDNHLHKIPVTNLKTQILGDDASAIPLLTSRVNQLEREYGNLALEMLASQESAPDCNLIITEDFANPDMVDTYVKSVKSAVAGSNSIDLEDDAGVIAGGHYWISDGVRQEYIQVRSIIRNGAIYRILAEDNLVETYDLTKTYLYRTTALISESIAYGSGNQKGMAYQPTLVWRGVSANVATNLALETTQRNADSFSLEGDYAFTTDGFFTLAN